MAGKSMRQQALALAGMGFRVFPVHEGGKNPAIKEWPKNATTDETQIGTWWSGNNADSNIGIATGKMSGVFVLDVDVGAGKNGMESLADLEKKIGPIPRDMVVRTGSGGLHIYLKYPDDGKPIRNSVGSLGSGLDIRGEGGYVVAPGSLHECGQRYVWEPTADNDDVVESAEPFAPCPALVNLIRGGGKGKGISTKPGDFLKEGGRNETLFAEARNLYLRGRRPEEVLAVISAMNSSLGNPPLPDSEIETLVASAANYRPDFPRTDIEWGQLIAQRLAGWFRQVGGQWYVWEAPCWKAGADAAWLEAVKGLGWSIHRN